MAATDDPDLAPPATPVGAGVGAVLVGGVLGGLARQRLVVLWPGGTVPWAVLLINVLGSFVLGGLVEVVARRSLQRHPVLAVRLLRPGVGTGFCGGFTTFSSLAVALDTDVRDGRPGTAVLYLALSLALGVGAAVAGAAAGRRVTP